MPVLNTAKNLLLGTTQVAAVYLGATLVWSPAPVWSPVEVTGCVLALEAADVPAGVVSAWPDRSLLSNVLIPYLGEATSTGEYVTVTSANALQSTNPLPFYGNASSHLFMRIRSRSVDGAFMGWGDLGTGQLYDLWNYRSRGSLIWHGYGSSFDTVAGAPLFTSDVWHIVEVSYNSAGRVEVHVDDLPEVGATSGPALSTAYNTLLLGRGRYFAAGDFDITGLFLYDRVLTEPERLAVRDYLSTS